MAGDNNEQLEETTPSVNINPFQMQAMVAEITKNVTDNMTRREEKTNEFLYGTRHPRPRSNGRAARRTRGEARIDESDDSYSSSERSDNRSMRDHNPRPRADDNLGYIKLRIPPFLVRMIMMLTWNMKQDGVSL